MTTLLIVATGATVVLTSVKAAEAVTQLAGEGVKVGLTSMRGLMNGSLTKACGLEVLADEVLVAAEEPVVETKVAEAKPAKVKEPVVKEPVMNPNAAMPIADLLGLGNVAEPTTGWGMYLCKPESLMAKRERLIRKLRKIAKSNKLTDLNVQMINGEGSVDSLVFTRADSSIAYMVTPKKRWGVDLNAASVTDGNGTTVTGSWKEVVDFFANPAEEIAETQAEAA